MNINTTIIQWSIRVLAIVGILAILTLVWMMIARVSSPMDSSLSDVYATRESFSMGADRGIAQKGRIMGSPELLTNDGAQIDQKVIRTASLSLMVDDAAMSTQAITKVTSDAEGFVQSSSVMELEDGTRNGSIMIRVPSDRFDEVMTSIKALAVVVDQETVSQSDVTEQYIDLAARLNNAKLQETRYVDILKVADSVEEMLQIEQALANVRGTIESYTGQIQYLDSQTDFSSISISLSEEPIVQIGGKVFRPWTSVKQAAQAVVEIAQSLIVALIWVVMIGVGIGASLALMLWLGWKGYKKVIGKRR